MTVGKLIFARLGTNRGDVRCKRSRQKRSCTVKSRGTSRGAVIITRERVDGGQTRRKKDSREELA